MVKTVLGHDVYKVWAEGSQAYGKNHSRGNVFFEHGTLYSYGTHFTLGVRLPDGSLVLNADRYSVTTSGHQSATRGAVRGKRHILVPFSSLRNARVDPQSIEILDVEPDREIYMSKRKRRDGSEYDAYSHLMGRSVFKVEDRYYLAGIDETARNLWDGFFLAQLPFAVSSVGDAVEALKPAAVKDAEARGVEVKRQGEFFFIPVAGALRGATNGTYLLPHKRQDRRQRHRATELKSKDGTFYAKGTVRHTAGEHRMLKLPQWHTVHENMEVTSWSGAGRVD